MGQYNTYRMQHYLQQYDTGNELAEKSALEIYSQACWKKVKKLISGKRVQKILQVRCGNTPCLGDDILSIRLSDITAYRNPPEYDLIFFTFTENQKPDESIIASFQYCRMLLKPGGMLALLLPDTEKRKWYSRLCIDLRASKSYVLVQQAGLVNVRQVSYNDFGMIITGYRHTGYTRRR